MIEELIQSNCIKLGSFTLKSGDISKYYFDMKNIISYPNMLAKIGDEIYKKLQDFDIICGIPYGGLPIASYISTKYNKPLIFVRDKAKNYGTQKLIEGEYDKSKKCVIIDDVITTGGSIQYNIDVLKDKVDLVEVAVIFDRQQNYNCSLPVKSYLCKNDIIKYKLKKIMKEKQSKLCFSADLNDKNKIIDILKKIGDKIVVCKIHYDILEDNDGEFKKDLINVSIKHDFLIMEDRKFNDISYIVEKQYSKFKNWVDLVTVHSLVSSDVINCLSGALLIGSMSNNNHDFTDIALQHAKNNKNNVIGFITQKRIDCDDLICMTPGVSTKETNDKDQKYRTSSNVDTDIIIVGRAIYNSPNIEETILELVN